jgi:hypothetical protein
MITIIDNEEDTMEGFEHNQESHLEFCIHSAELRMTLVEDGVRNNPKTGTDQFDTLPSAWTNHSRNYPLTCTWMRRGQRDIEAAWPAWKAPPTEPSEASIGGQPGHKYPLLTVVDRP